MTEQLPVFETARLTVRPRSIDDLDACLEMDGDPEVARFVAGPWADPVAHRAFVENRIRHTYPIGMGYRSIMAPDFVGWILLTPLDLVGPEVEIGWRVTAKARGHGYATEAARCVLGYALNELRLPQVVADIDPANIASVAVAGKLGLRPAGTVRYAGGIVIRYIAARCWS
jgi:RimJ/RimL family protein N-acetyltransferase